MGTQNFHQPHVVTYHCSPVPPRLIVSLPTSDISTLLKSWGELCRSRGHFVQLTLLYALNFYGFPAVSSLGSSWFSIPIFRLKILLTINWDIPWCSPHCFPFLRMIIPCCQCPIYENIYLVLLSSSFGFRNDSSPCSLCLVHLDQEDKSHLSSFTYGYKLNLKRKKKLNPQSEKTSSCSILIIISF